MRAALLDRGPAVIGTLDESCVDGGSAIAATGDLVIAGSPPRVIDVTDPRAPRVRGTIGGEAADIAAQGAFGYIVSGSELRVVDLSNPDAPAVVATVDMGLNLQHVAASDDRAVAASGRTILSIDVSDPANPSVLGSSGVDHVIQNMALDGGRLFVVYSEFVISADGSGEEFYLGVEGVLAFDVSVTAGMPGFLGESWVDVILLDPWSGKRPI